MENGESPEGNASLQDDRPDNEVVVAANPSIQQDTISLAGMTKDRICLSVPNLEDAVLLAVNHVRRMADGQGTYQFEVASQTRGSRRYVVRMSKNFQYNTFLALRANIWCGCPGFRVLSRDAGDMVCKHCGAVLLFIMQTREKDLASRSSSKR